MRKRNEWICLLFFQLTIYSPSVLYEITGQQQVNTIATKYKINPLVDDLDYGKYAKEVLKLIKSHDDVHNNLIKDFDKGGLENGKIRKQLVELLPSNYRSDLDELKRLELGRIKRYGEDLLNRGRSESSIRRIVKALSSHLDLQDLRRFGTDDLRKLIKKSSKDIQRLDGMRKLRFKEYELQKRLEMDELKKRLSPEALAQVEKNIGDLYRKHQLRKPMHMPASKAHLLKVWEERDHMHKDNFNIKTFFRLHDLDGNEFLDEDEVKILVETEIKGQYDPGDPDFDPLEKNEEKEKMREYVFINVDNDKDHLISMKEFIEHVERKGMDDSHFWDVQGQQFTEEEYAKYANVNREEVNKMIDQGLIKLPETGIVVHKEKTESMHTQATRK